ncbi:MAG: sulfocyanin-like copper-binding protein [Gemmatimonadales bacterium]
MKALVAAVMLPVAIGGQTAPPAQVIDPAWLMVDSSTKTATFKLIAGLTGLNGALNFNGFRDGGLTLTVPLGWNVVMKFSNHDGDLPHSAEVIANTKPLPYGPVDAAFDRAVTIRLAQGLEAGAEDDIRFVASKAGSFIVFCAVPGHGAAGMWIRFRVSESAGRPGLAATPAAGS